MLPVLKNKKIIKIAGACLMALLAIFLLANLSLAANGPDVGIDYPAGTGLSNSTDIRIIIARIIRIIIGFLGIIALGIIIYAGWLWMSSAGSEEKIEQAKKLLTNAAIGLVIILASFALASFILNMLTGAGNNSGYSATTAGGGSYGGGIPALGSGIIESHYPARGQKDIPRNTKIIVSFKEPIDPATIMTGNKINAQNIKIYKTKDGTSGLVSFDVGAAKTADNKIFVFQPSQYLGSPSEKIWYSVALSKNIKKANGDAAFGGIVGETAYEWMFEVGTFIDDTPPKIENVIPIPAGTEPRNVVVQINFSEAVDPISASGATDKNFNNIKVADDASKSPIQGTFYISNQYKTVEFLTNDACGVNSCGDTVYCLPGNKKIKAFASAATLIASGTPAAGFPYDGVVDMANNSLDGNGDGKAEGPQAQSGLVPYNADNQTHASEGDDYYWTFNTNNTIDNSAPKIEQIEPQVGGSSVSLSATPWAAFSKLLLSSSLNSSSVNLNGSSNYWIYKRDNSAVKRTTVNIGHDQFNENTNYGIQFNSGIKDIYQNCYTPCSGLGVTGGPSCCNGAASNRASCQ